MSSIQLELSGEKLDHRMETHLQPAFIAPYNSEMITIPPEFAAASIAKTQVAVENVTGMITLKLPTRSARKFGINRPTTPPALMKETCHLGVSKFAIE